MSWRKTLEKVLGGQSDYNIRFSELCGLLRHFDFDERVEGSHHIFTRADVKEIVNIQPKGSLAKGYQVQQVRSIFRAYHIGEE